MQFLAAFLSLLALASATVIPKRNADNGTNIDHLNLPDLHQVQATVYNTSYHDAHLNLTDLEDFVRHVGEELEHDVNVTLKEIYSDFNPAQADLEPRGHSRYPIDLHVWEGLGCHKNALEWVIRKDVCYNVKKGGSIEMGVIPEGCTAFMWPYANCKHDVGPSMANNYGPGCWDFEKFKSIRNECEDGGK